ncbi:hypothetical protein BGW38_010694 [Lunasporangiospora selenospora]|uniref:Thioredoxin domain-containing protein n=1 Tax=Lunasporangiospora selenospora TaxID=979761 RepID=A0A9P6FVX6_9FUNG|nr:hypothetical protein BGW38_010694 [Lunasporangiospora selenospora]
MAPNPPLTETEKLLIDAYTTILNEPFEDKYEDKFKIDSYEAIRAQLKKGPPMCFRPGWKSPILGHRYDPTHIASKCRHVHGPAYTGQERIVVLDFWASWCDPCVSASPEVSQLADEFAGRIAILGINNESIFGVTKPPNLDLLSTFLNEHQDEFRYTVLVDDAEGYAKDAVYKPSGYRGIPCAVLLIDGVVSYVGSPLDTFRNVLVDTLISVYGPSAGAAVSTTHLGPTVGMTGPGAVGVAPSTPPSSSDE